LVRDLLAEIDQHPRRDLAVPHGFALDRLSVEERANLFAPSVLSTHVVTVEMRVPVIYSPDSTGVPLRASLPAHTNNLEHLRDWIAAAAKAAPAARAELTGWSVSPDEAPAPYLPSGEPAGPPAEWAVTAVVEVA
jgi:hypothetical protein